MKLQLALDLVDIAEAKSILSEVHDLIDIVEIGTPFLIREGIRAITEIKQAYPALEILADVKIMDAGDHEARLVLEAGADIVTVLGAATDATIQKALKTTRSYQRRLMVDLIALKQIEQRATQIDKMGVDYLCVHTATDIQETGENPLEGVRRIQKIVKHATLAVAGGISSATLPSLLSYQPEIIIVGGAITSQPDKREVTRKIREMMQ